ncbi:HAD family hydrolase [Agarilytica rhodophyticola]|uniref:HAD family hydrolase n=1 Tax=Agarilytica rhodophyticola TaxID=1737490 RepID=UPI0013154B56|nr:HAD family hydrolase [Agarilytica rhodophyticola]
MVKVVVSDLDGTLLNGEHRVSSYTCERIQKLAERDIEFLIATGRHYCDLNHIVEALGGNIYLITSNGAQVHDRDGALVHSVTIPKNLVDEVITISRGYDVQVNVYSENAWYVEQPNERLLTMHHDSKFYYRQVSFRQISLEGIFKIYFCGQHEQLQRLCLDLKNRYVDQLSITFSFDTILEVMGKDVSKASALGVFGQRESFSLDKMMAFGDGLNDLEMLQAVGHAVVMDNAHPKVKQSITDYNTAPVNTDDGVARYLEEYFW